MAGVLAGGLLALVTPAAASAALLAAYNFTGSSLDPAMVAPGLSASAVTLGGGVTRAPLVGSLVLSISDLAMDEASAVANESFFQFTLAPDAGSALDLNDVGFNYGMSGLNATLFFRSSLDGFTSNLVKIPVLFNWPAPGVFGMGFVPSLQDLTTPVTFRLYAYSTNPDALMFFDGPGVGGTVEPLASVPEPVSWALMILGLGAAGAAMRRRRFVLAG